MPQTNYIYAYQIACQALAAEKDPEGVARRAACRFDREGSFFEVPVLGRLYRVEFPGGEVTAGEPLPAPAMAGGGATAPTPDARLVPGAPLPVPPAPAGDHLLTISILLLHYLTLACGTPKTGEWIAFRELPGGEIYNTPFTNRLIRPMAGRFGREPGKLVEAALCLGGRREAFGHASASVDVFPMVPVCFVVWEGDEEIPASGQVLFDRSASAYLDTEDLVVAAAEAFLAARMAGTPGQPRPQTLEPT